MPDRSLAQTASRRQFLAVAIGVSGVMPLVSLRSARASPATMEAAIRKVVGESPVAPGKVKLDLPPLVENGNTVALTVSVDSPMTPSDHVKAIYLFNEKNPQPNIANFYLGPRSGKPSVSTRIRLADSQKVVAIAELSDGTFWSETVDLIVTLAACVEE